MMETEKTAEILRKVSNFLRTLTDDQVDDLITGKARLSLTQTQAKERVAKRSTITKPDVDHIRKELMSKQTREEGTEFLNGLGFNRLSLQKVAAGMDLPTPKTDTVEKLKERIVEATIGYRLRSNAIRSTD